MILGNRLFLYIICFLILTNNVFAQVIDVNLPSNQNFQNAKNFVISILKKDNGFDVCFYRTYDSTEYITCYRTKFKEYENLIAINFDNLDLISSEAEWVFILAREVTRIHMYDEAVERNPELLKIMTEEPELAEYVCDEYALRVLILCGYDPMACISFYEKYEHISEPTSQQRIEKLLELMSN